MSEVSTIQQFEVRTDRGRRFVWAAYDADDCKRHVEWAGHTPISIWPFKEGQAK